MSIGAQLFADIIDILTRYGRSYLNGAISTTVLALVSTILGCLIGFVCGVLNTIPCSKRDRRSKRVLLWIVRALIRAYVEVFRGTPMVLQAVFVYYGLPYFTNFTVRFSSVWAASILVVSVNTGAYMAESVRGGILSIDPGQTEGAKALGLTHFQTMTSIILPQALRNILPQIGNNYIINIKDTSVMFIISFTELFAVHRAVVGATYLYFPSAVVEMVVYLMLTLMASVTLRALERKLAGPDSYKLANADQLVMAAGTYNYSTKEGGDV